MKRRKLLQILGLIPPALLVSSCKEKLPSTPTIVTGKIIDEKGLPWEGAGLSMSGINWKGFTPVPTFLAVDSKSDKDGIYKISQLVPEGTDDISILPQSTDKIKVDIGFSDYVTYIFLDGHYMQLGAPYDIPRSDWGKTTTLNYQFIPR